MTPMTVSKIKAEDYPLKRGFVGPLFWRYSRGYGIAPMLLYKVQQLPKGSRAKFCGPVYIERPER